MFFNESLALISKYVKCEGLVFTNILSRYYKSIKMSSIDYFGYYTVFPVILLFYIKCVNFLQNFSLVICPKYTVYKYVIHEIYVSNKLTLCFGLYMFSLSLKYVSKHTIH